MKNVLERISGVKPEQLQSLLLNTRVEPYMLRMIGHEAFLGGDSDVYEVAQQVCFDKGSNPDTLKPTDYSDVYIFLGQLPKEEIIIYE